MAGIHLFKSPDGVVLVERRFDSDPRRTVPMITGCRQEGFRMELFHKDEDYSKFNLYGFKTEKSPTESFLGTLVTTSMKKSQELLGTT